MEVLYCIIQRALGTELHKNTSVQSKPIIKSDFRPNDNSSCSKATDRLFSLVFPLCRKEQESFLNLNVPYADG